MKKLIVALLLCFSLASCVTGLSRSEENEYVMYKKKSLDADIKNKYVGAGLGLLPGGGSFYTGHAMYGVGNLLLWPASILWDPMNGYNGSEKINYDHAKEIVTRKKEMEIRDLTVKLEAGIINQQKYTIEKQKIEDKYSVNF